jgi:hypothetical protein
VSPTVITPTLVPCVVGVCKQIIEVLETTAAGSSSLNSDALIQLPAFFVASDATGSPKVYGGLDGLALIMSINLGANVTVTFADTGATGITPTTAVSQILAAFTTAGVTTATAEVVGDGFRIRTIGTGEFQTIFIDKTTAPAVAAAFGIGVGQTYVGLGSYNQYEVKIPQSNFPDPRGNLSELAIESSSIRVFLATGNSTGLQEALTDTAFCRNGSVDIGAVVTGSTDLTTLTYPGDVQGDQILATVDGGSQQTHTIASSPADAAALIAELDANLTGIDVTLDGSNFAVFTSATGGVDSSILLNDGTPNLLTDLGISDGATDIGESIESVDDGNGDAVTPLIKFLGHDFTTTPTAAVVTGSVDITALTYPADLADKTLILSDGQQEQTITFATLIADENEVLTEINDVMGTAVGGRLTASLSTNFLRLTHSLTGTDSFIKVVGGTAVTTLGLVVGTDYASALSLPEPGDELWIDGVYYADVAQVAPGAVVTNIKINAQVPISSDVGTDFYFVAKNLPSADASRPDPDLVVDLNGNVTIKHELLRDTQGNATATVAPVYLTYSAVRLDVTGRAASPGLLTFDDTTQLDDSLEPISSANPLALGLYFAMINAPGIQVSGIGVDEISADAPYGTTDAFTRAAEFLEAHEVYGIAPLTHAKDVAEVFKTHVDVMSEAENKGERICLWNPDVPTRDLDDLVASGTNGNTIGAGGLTFDTGIANLSALVLNAGISPVGTIAATEGLFLDIASDALNYSIATVSGSIVTIRKTFVTGENDDGFYSTTDLNDPPLTGSLIQEAFSIKVRGDELVTVSGDADRLAIAETMQALGQSYLDRRFWMTFPDSCAATLDGLEQILEGFYMNAAVAGMIGQNPPQQSFTNYPMTGFTRVIGSNKTYSERQLNIMAAGGTYIIIQDVEGGPLISRMALTTDLTSIETRTDSITKVVDFTAKFLRRGLRNFIGRFNITQGFMDSLGSVIQGLLGFLVETGVLIGANLNNLIQDEDAPDTVLVDITLDVPYPCNYIRVTLVV